MCLHPTLNIYSASIDVFLLWKKNEWLVNIKVTQESQYTEHSIQSNIWHQRGNIYTVSIVYLLIHSPHDHHRTKSETNTTS